MLTQQLTICSDFMNGLYTIPERFFTWIVVCFIFQGELFKNQRMLSAVNGLPELSNLKGQGPKMLQLVRSTPYVTATLVGHKDEKHVEENVALSTVAPLSRSMFLSAMSQLNTRLATLER